MINNKVTLIKHLALLVFVLLMNSQTNAQQSPQYTHYMYNTMTVNAAYAGQRDILSATVLNRTQWVGINGAPETLTFGIHTPLRNQRLGLGLNVISDQLGPSRETTVNANVSYTLPVNASGDLELSFGLNGGMHLLDTDWSKGTFKNSDRLFNENVNLISPTLGFGLYLHSDTWYLGASVPNIITSNHYDDFQESIATERLHYFLIGGYVFNLNKSTKLKPALLVKGVSGAPLIADVSINALFQEKFTLGLAWRWDDSVSGLIGFQITPTLQIGYSYDATTTGLSNYNSGTHEVMLRFELQKIGRILSPRFF